MSVAHFTGIVLSQCLLLIGYSALGAGPDVKPAAVGSISLIERASPYQILVRETARQALLNAAREEFGLKTRDAVLQESADTDAGENWPFAVEVDASKNETASVVVFHVTSKGPFEVFRRELRVPRSQRLEYAVEQAEQWSTKEFCDLLVARGFKKKPRGSGVAQPVDALTSLDEIGGLDPISQFGAIRQLHERLAAKGDWPTCRCALARHYALLGSLTELHWNVGHKVFKARALLAAQRAVRKWPEDPVVWWSRAYVRALCGLHQPALEDLAEARRLGGAEPPKWAPALDAFCSWNAENLAIAQPEESPIAPYLKLLAAEIAGTPASRIDGAEKLLQTDPNCYRAAGTLATERSLGTRSMAAHHPTQTFASSLPGLMAKTPGLPETVMRMLPGKRGDDAANQTPGWRAKLVGALINSGHPDRDNGEPSWQVLGRLIDDMTFQQAIALLEFEKSWLAIDSSESVQQLSEMLANHPLQAGIVCFSTDAAKARAAAVAIMPRLQSMEFSEGSRSFLKMVERYQRIQGLVDNVFRQRDDTVSELAIQLRTASRATNLTVEIEQLHRLAPDCPVGISAAIERNWKEVAPMAREWEERYSRSPEVLYKLAAQYEQVGLPEDAERCLKRVTVVERDSVSFYTLSQFYKRQENWDSWKATMEELMQLPSRGLEQASAARDLARFLMSREQWEAARPYADAAAESYSAWGLECAAECYQGLKDWGKAEELMRARAERYDNEQMDWYLWCRRTGHGNLDEARKLAERSLTGPSGLSETELRLRRAVMFELEGDLQSALGVYRDALKKSAANYDRMMAALAEHGLGHIEERDALLTEIASSKNYETLPFLCRSLLRSLKQQRPPADDVELEWYAALETNYGLPTNHFYFIGRALQVLGQEDRAATWLQRSATSPNRNKMTTTLAGATLVRMGKEVPPMRLGEFDVSRRKAIELLGKGYSENAAKLPDQALASYQAAAGAAADWPFTHYMLAVGYRAVNRREDAERECSSLLEKISGVPELYVFRGQIREELHRYREAVADYEQALAIDPEQRGLTLQLAWFLAVCPDDAVRDAKKAVAYAEKAAGNPLPIRWTELGVLAAAYAEAGDLEKAVKIQETAVANAGPKDKKQAQSRLGSFRAGKPLRSAKPSWKLGDNN